MKLKEFFKGESFPFDIYDKEKNHCYREYEDGTYDIMIYNKKGDLLDTMRFDQEILDENDNYKMIIDPAILGRDRFTED